MLSPCDYSSDIPRDKLGNLLWRLHVLDACEREPKYRAALIEACRDDIFFYILTFVYQFNPNFIPGGQWEEYGPFVTVEYQEHAVREILYCIYEREDLLIEKSREMGISWLCLIVLVWLWNFHRRKEGFCLSRNEEAVDRPGDSKSLFWKIDYILDYMPTWLLQGYSPQQHRRKRSFNHPATMGSITGEATTEAAGVGGRATVAFLDEFPRVPKGFEMLAGTAATTRCRIFNGTHQGIDTAFFSLTERVDIRRLQLHWTKHPDKRVGLYRWSKTLKRVESLDPTFEFQPQCSKCLKLCPGAAVGGSSPCCERLIQDFKFVTDGSPLGGPFPGLRSPWYDAEARRIGTPQKVAEELDINPIGSVTQAFDPGVILELISWARPPIWEGDLDYDWETGEPKKLVFRKGGPVKLWIRPDANGRVPLGLYKIGCDVSHGLGKTPSCASIGDAHRGAKVGELVVSDVKPDRFAGLMVALARLFCTESGEGAEIIWEGQGPGATFGKQITETLGYRNIYWRTIEQKLQKVRRADTPGWNPSPENKDDLLRQYGFALASKDYTTESEPELRECLKYKFENGHMVHPLEKGVNDPSGAKHNHGDLAMSAALCYKLVKEAGEAERPAAIRPKEVNENSFDGRMRMWERTRHLADCWLE